MVLSGSCKDNTINKNKKIDIELLKKIIDERTIAKNAFKKTIEAWKRKGLSLGKDDIK
jgi:hypothetical protein